MKSYFVMLCQYVTANMVNGQFVGTALTHKIAEGMSASEIGRALGMSPKEMGGGLQKVKTDWNELRFRNPSLPNLFPDRSERKSAEREAVNAMLVAMGIGGEKQIGIEPAVDGSTGHIKNEVQSPTTKKRK